MTDKDPDSKTHRISKPLAFALVSLIFSTASPHCQAQAKGRGGGGGVYLTTPEPTNPLEHNNRAVELGTKGLWDAAIREHEIALDGDPENTMFRRNLSGAHLRYADILAGKKHYKEAIKHYTLALYADQNNGPGRRQPRCDFAPHRQKSIQCQVLARCCRQGHAGGRSAHSRPSTAQVH